MTGISDSRGTDWAETTEWTDRCVIRSDSKRNEPEKFRNDLGRHWVAEVVPILIDSLRLQSVPAAIDPSNSLFPANPAFFVVDA